ncbi:MAG: DUF1329 domain-containing protein [Candidatus Binataceae bacterium]
MKHSIRSIAVIFNSICTILGLTIFAVNAFAQQSTSSPAIAPATTSPQTGTVITAANSTSYARFLPPGADLAIKYGLAMRVTPTKRLDWSEGFTAETEKYSGQVGLDKDDYITNYVAGMPFPTVSTDDPKAAIKIAYNWHMGPFMPDDFSLEPWGSFAYSTTGAPNSFVPDEEESYVCNRFTFLRFAHRTEVDPRPTLGANEEGAEWKARSEGWAGGPTVSPNPNARGVVVRYLDPRKQDVSYANQGVGRWEVVAAPNEQCRSCHQPFWAYALPKTENYSYRLLGTATMLACLTADQEPAGIVQHDKTLSFTEEPFQLRNAYIIEMIPKSDQKLRTVVYIDTEAYVWIGAEFFARNEETEVAFPFWRSYPSSSGGYLFDLAGEFYVPLDQLTSPHLPFVHANTAPGLFFRSLAPAHGGFSQKINTGTLSEELFDRYMFNRE